MNDMNNDITNVLHPLRNRTWPGDAAAHNRVERRLLDAHAANRTPGFASSVFGFIVRHRLAAASVAIAVIAGSAIAGSYLFNRLYTVTVSDEQGQIISSPRILVAPGQRASITISDSDDPDNALHIEVDEGGNITSNRDDVNIDVDVQNVDAKKPDSE